MNTVCAASPAGGIYAGSGGFSGTVKLTAPFVYTDTGAYMNTLSVNNTVTLMTPLTLSLCVQINTSSAGTLRGSKALPVPLSAMNEPSVQVSIAGSLGITADTQICSMLSRKTEGLCRISLTTGDSGYRDVYKIFTPLDLTGFSMSSKIYLPQTTAKAISDSLSVKADGKDVTDKLTGAVIRLFGQNRDMTAEAYFTQMSCSFRKLDISISETKYSFDLKGVDFSEGVFRASLVYGTADMKKSVDMKNIRASEAAAFFENIVFDTDDFILREAHGEYTHFEFAVFLAEISGSLVKRLPEGASLIYRKSANNHIYRPENIIYAEEKYEPAEIACIQVMYGRYGDGHTAVEPSVRKTKTGSTISLKVYGDSGRKIYSDAPHIKLCAKGISEICTENVFFKNGKGGVSKPPSAMLTAGIRYDGRDVYCGNSVFSKEVTYKTVYDLYEMSSEKAGDMTFYVQTGNTASFFTGKSGITETIYAPEICDHTTAIRIAEKRYENHARVKILTAPHSSVLNTSAGLNIKTAFAEGAVTGALIDIKNAPVRITDRLEVLPWQK